MRHLRLKPQSGFTLLELLIVIVIIGILAFIIVPGLASGPKRGRDAQRKADLHGIKDALESYYNDNTSYPSGDYAGLASQLIPHYMPSLPQDPKSGNPGYSYNPIPNGCAAGNCSSFTLNATLENSTDSQIKPGSGNIYEIVSIN